MSRILVTGGSGYLGGRIVEHLRSLGHDVSAGTRSQSRAGSAGFILTDFENTAGLSEAFSGFHAIIHLAGMNEIEAAKNPEAALHTTAVYALRAIQAAKAASVERFVYFSTVHVYGAPLTGLLTEGSVTRPVHPYSITHRAAEDFVFQAHREGSIAATIFRLSNGYGFPESPAIDRWSLLVNDLCRQVALSGQITLKSSGLQYRDFIPLVDVCSAVEFSLEMPRQSDPFFNLGSGQSVTVLELAKLIAARYQAVTGQVAVMNIPAAKADEAPMPFNLSVEKLRQAGFSARSLVNEEIDEFISRCLAWQKAGLF